MIEKGRLMVRKISEVLGFMGDNLRKCYVKADLLCTNSMGHSMRQNV